MARVLVLGNRPVLSTEVDENADGFWQVQAKCSILEFQRISWLMLGPDF